MSNKRSRHDQNKGGHGGSNSNDFISKMVDDVLLMILSFLPIKDAVVTGSLSTRWRFLWCNLMKLNFDGSKTLDKMAKSWKPCVSERSYINQVNSVIRTYNRRQIVQEFRLRFNMNGDHKGVIDEWLQFTLSKKVEMLELDFMEDCHWIRDHEINYDFPMRLSDRNVTHLFKSTDTVVELVFLKKLILKNVNVREEILQEFLANSPYLETISIFGSGYLKHIRVGGRTLNLKHFDIVDCFLVSSIYLSDFELVSFTYSGQAIDLSLARLPKLRKLDLGQGFSGLENNVFSQISSCASSLHILSFKIYRPEKVLRLKLSRKLPNVKIFTLSVGAHKDESDDCLLNLASIANACPNLETFTIEVLTFYSPIRRRRKARDDSTLHSHEHLKLFLFLGYYGRISDLELVASIIHNSVELKKVVIDPRCQDWMGGQTEKDFFIKNERLARTSAQRQLLSIFPPGVELIIL